MNENQSNAVPTLSVNWSAKRVGNLYPLVCDRENVRLAIIRASKGKRRRPTVANILNNLDYFTDKLVDILERMAYVPAPYHVRERYDGIQKKRRQIAEPKFFPDQCIHHALFQVIDRVMLRGMYEFSCGSIPGRGIHKAKKAIEKWIRNDPKNTKYILKMDIRKFYPSVSHDVLKAKFRARIKDPQVLWLIDTIIDSYGPGIPIGTYTSQWFSNFILQDLDHFIKEKLKIKHSVRYIDDIVCTGPNKKALHKARIAIAIELSKMALCLKPNWQVFPLKSRPLDFLGFKFYREKTTIRKSIALRIRRKAKHIAKAQKITPRNTSAMVSYMGWIKHSDSRHFFKVYIKPYVNLTELKGVIKNESRKQQEAA